MRTITSEFEPDLSRLMAQAMGSRPDDLVCRIRKYAQGTVSERELKILAYFLRVDVAKQWRARVEGGENRDEENQP
jgi:hypothetical protein